MSTPRGIGAATVCAAVVVVFVFGRGVCNAVDWSDEDCRRWEGTPQHADCTAAHRALVSADCSQWLHGGDEWVKCEDAHRATRAKGCLRYISDGAKLNECLAGGDPE
jgi:hypothetical protein